MRTLFAALLGGFLLVGCAAPRQVQSETDCGPGLMATEPLYGRWLEQEPASFEISNHVPREWLFHFINGAYIRV